MDFEIYSLSHTMQTIKLDKPSRLNQRNPANGNISLAALKTLPFAKGQTATLISQQ